MGRIYSQSYFHYTKDIDNLIGILRNGFQGHYCREEFKYSGKIFNIYIPLVSFCDIPLYHIPTVTYGGYGIGMSSKWGNQVKLAPVCYFPRNTRIPLTSFISKQANDFYNKLNSNGHILGRCPKLVAYAKPVKKYKSYGHQLDNYIEKEWRRVYFMCSTDEKYHSTECKELQLSFNIGDVEFLIVPNEVKRKELIQRIIDLDKISNISITPPSMYLNLISRIITIEEIKKNF